MSLRPRRAVFQLTPLLDLLLIVIFAQYMDVRHTGAQQENWFRNEAEQLVEEAQNDAQREQQQRIALQSEIDRMKQKLATIEDAGEQLRRNRDDLARQRQILGQFVAKTLSLSDEAVEKLMQRESFKDDTELARTIESFSKQSAGEAVRHVLSYSEVLKRCDLWEFYVDYSVAEKKHRLIFKSGDEQKIWLKSNIDDFESQFVSYIRQRPQPKSLVIILSGFIYEDLTYADQLAYRRLLEQSVFDLNTAAGGQSRYYFTDLGYLGEFGLFSKSKTN